MARGEIPRHNNGLINFAALGRFYPPNSVGVPFGVFSNGTWKNHHAYFKRDEWNKPHIAPEDRTPLEQLRIDFRKLRYNRLILLTLDEGDLHKKFGTVDPEALCQETVEDSLRDFDVVDLLRYAVAGLAISTKKLGRLSHIQSDLLEIDINERINFFTACRDEAISKLEEPKITPRDVVTSLIGRSAQALNDPFLYEVSIERMRLWQKLGKKPNFYPFDVLPLEEATTGAKALLRKAFAAEIGIVEIEDKTLLPKYDWSRHPVGAAAAA